MKDFFEDIVKFIAGTLFLYYDENTRVLRKVYYKYDTQWKHHVYECPSLCYSTTVDDKFSVVDGWAIAQDRLRKGLQ